MSKWQLPPGIWDNPRPEDKDAYLAFVAVWSADNSSYEEYEVNKSREDSVDVADSILKAQAYGCTTEGTDSTTGTDGTFVLTDSTHDGYVSSSGTSYPSSTEVYIGGNTVEALDEGVDIPESEVILTAQATYKLWAWFDFQSVNIPQGATINKAFVRFEAGGVGDGGIDVIVCAEDADSPSATPTSSTMPNKSRTDNRVTWAVTNSWSGEIDTDDIACVIQEIVDRSGWSSGNALRVFVDNDPAEAYRLSACVAYDDTPSNSAKLIVWYNTNEIGSGGIELAGLADVKVAYNTTGSGVIQASGEIAKWISESMSGGVEISGEIAKWISESMFGGVAVSSFDIHAIIGEGGAQVGGSLIPVKVYPWTMTGGVMIPVTQVVPEYKPNECCFPRQSRVLSLNELNWLDQEIFITEVQEKTESGGLLWNSIHGMIHFQATELPYDYVLVKTQFGITFDVFEDTQRIDTDRYLQGTFNSGTHERIQYLFDQVEFMLKDDRRLGDTLKKVQDFSDCRLI